MKMSKNYIKQEKIPAILTSMSRPFTLRKRKKYKEFIRLIRGGEYGYFIESAKQLGLNRETISRWYYTKPAQRAADLAAEEAVIEIPKQKITWRQMDKMLDIFK